MVLLDGEQKTDCGEDRRQGARPCAYATPKLTRRIAANTSARLSARPGKSRWQ
ncbi:MAG: hypothetical protein LBD06_02135 [Candidatus Accumulibacter sp.]|nr:hypothetical protein [Accumulibacter sp.]